MNLVVAINDADSAKNALEYILKEKYSKDTIIHLVHVIPPGFAEAPVEGIPDVIAEERKDETILLENTAQSLRTALGITVSTAILTGEIADTIAKACKQFAADQVIVPSHARHGFSKIWFGSVADEIVDSAPCSVVVLKMPQGKLSS